jgi:hypothetical protein
VAADGFTGLVLVHTVGTFDLEVTLARSAAGAPWLASSIVPAGRAS